MSNSGWSVTKDAVVAMKNLSTELNDKLKEISQEVSNLKSVYEENQNGLGPHSASIKNLLDDLNDTTEDASEPVKKLVKKLIIAASIRLGIINTNGYGGRSR